MTAKTRLRKMKRPELMREAEALGIIRRSAHLYGTMALREAIEGIWAKRGIDRPGCYVAEGVED